MRMQLQGSHHGTGQRPVAKVAHHSLHVSSSKGQSHSCMQAPALQITPLRGRRSYPPNVADNVWNVGVGEHVLLCTQSLLMMILRMEFHASAGDIFYSRAFDIVEAGHTHAPAMTVNPSMRHRPLTPLPARLIALRNDPCSRFFPRPLA